MKPTTVLMTGIIVIALGCAVGSALTEQWRHPVDGEIFQVLADGKGGCGIAVLVTDDVFRVEWIDKKGEVLFDSGKMGGVFSIGTLSGPIHECTPRQLVFTGTYFFPYLIQVTRAGKILPAFALGGFVLGSPYSTTPIMSLPSSRFTDKKGFFVINVDTNTEAQTLVRYTYK